MHPPSDRSTTQPSVVLLWDNLIGNDTTDLSIAGYELDGNGLGGGKVGLQRLVSALRKLPVGMVVKVTPRAVLPAPVGGDPSGYTGSTRTLGMPPGFRDAIEEVARNRRLTLLYWRSGVNPTLREKVGGGK